MSESGSPTLPPEQKPSKLQLVATAIAFGVPMGAFFTWKTHGAGNGVTTGVLAGIAFAVALSRFAERSMSTTDLEMGGRAAELEAGETLVYFGGANHWKGAEAVGGKLFLTSQRLRFRAHRMNVQQHDESYPIGDLIGVEPTRSLGIVPNGLLVHLRDGRSERFVVNGRAAWIARLRPLCAP